MADGLAVSRANIGAIFGWALLSTTVGLIFSLLESQGGIFGQIVSRLLNVAWSLVTFLAVPVIAIEGTGPIETLKRSGTLFRERWGQQITGNVAIGGIVALLGFLPAILLFFAGIALWNTSSFIGALLVIVAIILFAISALVASALNGIFGVALYHYAGEGATIGPFTTADLESAVKRTGGAGPAPSTI